MSSSLEETRRKYMLASIHQRSLLSAIASDDSTTKKRPIRTETSSSPYKIQLGRVKQRSFTKRKRKSVTPKRRKVRKSKSSERSQESSPEFEIFERKRRRTETSDSQDTVLLYHSPRKVRQARAITSSPTTESPIFVRRGRNGSRKNLKSSEGRSADDLLRDVPAEYLSQVATTFSDADTDELLPRKDSIHKTYEALGKKRTAVELTNERYNLMDTGTSDRMWEEFVNDNYDKIVKYLKPVSANDSGDDTLPFKETILSPATHNSSGRNAEKGNDDDAQRIRREASMGKGKPRSKTARGPKTTKATQGRGRRKVAPNQSGSWMDTADEYLNPDLEDVQFEKGGQNGGRMSLSEFRNVRNIEKAGSSKNSEPTEDVIEFPLNVDENWKKSKLITRRKSIECLKLIESDSDSESVRAEHRTIERTAVLRVKGDARPIDTHSNLARKRKIVDISNRPRPSTSGSQQIEHISPRELRKIHRMRKYALRLKMNQTAMNPERTPIKIKQEKVESKVNTSQVDLTIGEKSVSGKMHSKMQSRKIGKSKPTIKSIEILSDVKLKKRRVP